jgi:hypothetical protein
LLLRLDVVAGVSGLGGEGGAEGIKTRLDALPPVCKVGDTIRFLIVFSNWETVLPRLTCIEFKGVESSAVGVVRDSVEMLKLIIHCLIFIYLTRWFKFYSTFSISISIITCCSKYSTRFSNEDTLPLNRLIHWKRKP